MEGNKQKKTRLWSSKKKRQKQKNPREKSKAKFHVWKLLTELRFYL
jgi:hypothetical protein